MSSSSDVSSDDFVDIDSHSSSDHHAVHILRAELAAIRMRSAVEQVKLVLVANRLEVYGSLLGLPNGGGVAVRCVTQLQAVARRRHTLRRFRRARAAACTLQRRARRCLLPTRKCTPAMLNAAVTIQRILRGFFARYVHNPRRTVSSLLRALIAQRRRSEGLREKNKLALQLLSETRVVGDRMRDARRAVSEDFTYSIYDRRYV